MVKKAKINKNIKLYIVVKKILSSHMFLNKLINC